MATKAFLNRAQRAALTRTEAVVILFLILVLSALLVGFHGASARTQAQQLRCLSNLAQIMGALNLYTQDNQGLFPPNPDDGNTLPGYNWCPGQAGIGGGQEFNSDVLADGRICLVAPYLRSNASVFHCTVDPRKGLYSGIDPNRRGATVASARTLSMNAAVGTVDPVFRLSGGHSGKPKLPVDAPWLDNAHSHHHNSPWRTYGKTSDIVAPTPADLFVLIEEDPNSVNDASFSFGMNSAAWIDWPSALHQKAGVLAFADGHAELHKWVDSRTILRRHLSVKLLPPRVNLQPPVVTSNLPVPRSADWLWLSQHTSARNGK